MNWDDLRIFLSVARNRSLTAAAATLRIDPATISRRITRLEHGMGGALFLRSPKGYELTEAGARLLKDVEEMEAAAESAADAMGAGDSLTGGVRVGAPDGCANYLLPGVLGQIARDNPGLEVQILAAPRVLNLSQREADLAIAVSRPTVGHLTVQKISDYRLSLAADARYLASAPPIEAVDDLKRHAIVGYIPDMIFDKELDYLSAVGIDRPTLASNSVAVQLQLLRAGGGIGFVHDFALPDAPELQRVLPQDVSLTRSFWLVRHGKDRRGTRMRRLAEGIVDGMRREIARIETALDQPAPDGVAG